MFFQHAEVDQYVTVDGIGNKETEPTRSVEPFHLSGAMDTARELVLIMREELFSGCVLIRFGTQTLHPRFFIIFPTVSK